MMAIPQYAFHMFWGGLFGFAVGGTAGLVIGSVIGIITSSGVLWVTVYYVSQARRFMASEMERLHRRWVLKEEKPQPPRPAHVNLVGAVYTFFAGCEALLMMIVIVPGYEILAESHSAAYPFLQSFLSPAIDQFFATFPYLDHCFERLWAAGRGERALFIRLGVASIWIIGIYGAAKGCHGMIQGWVYHFRYMRLARFEIIRKQEFAVLALSAICFILLVTCIGTFTWNAELTFLNIKSIPNVSSYSYYGFLQYSKNLTATLFEVSVGFVAFLSFMIASPAVFSED